MQNAAGTTRRGNVSDHLANERTYLAYLRTAVAIISFGIAINRFSLFLHEINAMSGTAHASAAMTGTERLGIGMVLIGMALTGWAAVQYWRVHGEIERQDFRARPGAILVLTGVVLIAGLTVVLLFAE